MKEISTTLEFKGTVTIKIPNELAAKYPENQLPQIAERIALGHIIATTKNPDAPAEAIIDELTVLLGISEVEAETLWNHAKPDNVTGTWNGCLPRLTQQIQLQNKLHELGTPTGTEIKITEDSAKENLYALNVETNHPGLARQLAHYFGCPKENLPTPEDTNFEACDSWHGRGEGNLRDLADELTQTHGEFFNTTLTTK